MKLPRSRTLKSRADFQAVREKGQSASGKFLVLASLPKPGQPQFRFGLITTKKTGKAHERNHIRRLIREILVSEGPRFTPQADLVFIARWRAKDATLPQLKQDILKLAKKLNLTQPS
ncbi:MAG: ribonuclease P protein component [Verrucomicrobiota bacterium]